MSYSGLNGRFGGLVGTVTRPCIAATPRGRRLLQHGSLRGRALALFSVPLSPAGVKEEECVRVGRTAAQYKHTQDAVDYNISR